MTITEAKRDPAGSDTDRPLSAEEWQVRALQAEARLAEAFHAGIERVCDTFSWTIEMLDAWHRAMPNVPEAFRGLSNALRAHLDEAPDLLHPVNLPRPRTAVPHPLLAAFPPQRRKRDLTPACSEAFVAG